MSIIANVADRSTPSTTWPSTRVTPDANARTKPVPEPVVSRGGAAGRSATTAGAGGEADAGEGATGGGVGSGATAGSAGSGSTAAATIAVLGFAFGFLFAGLFGSPANALEAHDVT